MLNDATVNQKVGVRWKGLGVKIIQGKYRVKAFNSYHYLQCRGHLKINH